MLKNDKQTACFTQKIYCRKKIILLTLQSLCGIIYSLRAVCLFMAFCDRRISRKNYMGARSNIADRLGSPLPLGRTAHIYFLEDTYEKSWNYHGK